MTILDQPIMTSSKQSMFSLPILMMLCPTQWNGFVFWRRKPNFLLWKPCVGGGEVTSWGQDLELIEVTEAVKVRHWDFTAEGPLEAVVWL